MKSFPDPVELRHILHKNPEPSFKEFNTTKLIIESVKAISEDLVILTPFEIGLLVEYKVNSGSYLLFRADIDALPIIEQTSSQFSSKNGFMHACGHDIHTSILYGLLIEVCKQRTDRNILFLFQPAEEVGMGAKMFLDSGIFSGYKIDYAFSLHITDEFPYGVIATRKGSLFSSSTEIDIDITGKSSHITTPDKGISALDAFLEFLFNVSELSQIKNGEIFLGIGKVSIGQARNVLPGNAKLEGTIRSLNLSYIRDFLDELRLLSEDISIKRGTKIEINEGAECPEVIVNSYLFDMLMQSLSLKFPFLVCETKLTAEDFGFFSKRFSSFYFWLGCRKDEKIYGLHSPYFYPPDSIIEKGIYALLECIKILRF